VAVTASIEETVHVSAVSFALTIVFDPTNLVLARSLDDDSHLTALLLSNT